MAEIAVIFLAAGKSSRFSQGGAKLIADFAGEPLIRWGQFSTSLADFVANRSAGNQITFPGVIRTIRALFAPVWRR